MSTIKANTLLHSDGSTTNPPARPALDKRMASAWVNFNDDGGIIGSFGVSSITDSSTGVYTVNFSTAMANTNYVCLSGGGSYAEHLCFAGRSTGSFPCYGRDMSGNSVDTNGMCAVFAN